MDLVDLQAGSVVLRLQRGQNDWTQVYLLQQGNEFGLGAHTFGYIRERLVAMLGHWGDGKSSGKIDGTDVVWVMSIEEKHTSFYVARTGENLRLYFQDAHAHVFATAELTEADRRAWSAVLAQQ